MRKRWRIAERERIWEEVRNDGVKLVCVFVCLCVLNRFILPTPSQPLIQRRNLALSRTQTQKEKQMGAKPLHTNSDLTLGVMRNLSPPQEPSIASLSITPPLPLPRVAATHRSKSVTPTVLVS